MTDPVRTCDDHGAFVADCERCPACDAPGARLLSGERRRRLSKFLSGALRHFPNDVGLELDERGWTAFDDLIDAVERTYDWATAEHVAAVIATDPKGRFERTRTDTAAEHDDAGSRVRVRASYGHSVDVDLEPTDAPVPDDLYHGTAPATLDSIREEGLRPMNRQQVHLSGSRAAARRVGQRHADDPVLLAVDAAAMLADGHRIAKRGRETYTTDAVPPEYLSRVDDGDGDSTGNGSGQA
ncbi:RNA 2'-phosphotransferase [Natrinema salifodinae]|uniref:Probable RNA 2'-phosphotransferase n=1 Tax=Natrinema salifodinae TaxID=1202768 RepID=A0A1I0Q952_9EURY|nr:RNA 2'-phosphotransferase [Natrinema salifodinae]SEW23547.1 putative RNA 2'-phosphotransferase [Natrinema salifodinae]